MSSIKVKELPEKLDIPKDEDILVIEDSEDTKKINLIRLRSAFSMDGILTSMKEMLLEKINSFMKAHDARYKELYDRNIQLEVTCDNLENSHIHDMNRISELEDKLIVQTDSIKTLQAERIRLNELLTVVENEKNELAIRVDELDKQFANKKYNFNLLTSEFALLQKQYNILLAENNTLKETVNNLEATSNVSINEFIANTNIELATKMNELMAYIRHYHPDVDDLEV